MTACRLLAVDVVFALLAVDVVFDVVIVAAVGGSVRFFCFVSFCLRVDYLRFVHLKVFVFFFVLFEFNIKTV